MCEVVTEDSINETLFRCSWQYHNSDEGISYREEQSAIREDKFYNVKRIKYRSSERIVVYETKECKKFILRSTQCGWLVKFILTIRDQKLRISIIRRSDFGEETKEMLQDTYGLGMNEEAWDDYNRQNELEKIAATVKKSQKRLQGLCMANKFDLFFTLTFNPKIVDSRDYEAVKKALMNFLERMRKKYGKFDYIFVIELHKSGRAHCHGLTNGLNLGFVPKLNKRQEPVFEQNHAVYDCVEWSSKFGFGEYSKIENLEATSHYVSKYVSKEMFQLAPNKNRYLRSKGLKKPQIEYEHMDLSEGDVIESQPELVIHDWDKRAGKSFEKIKIYNKQWDPDTGEIIEESDTKETKDIATKEFQRVIDDLIESSG